MDTQSSTTNRKINKEGKTMKEAVTNALNDWLDKMLDRQAEAKKGVIPLSEKNPETCAAALDFLRSCILGYRLLHTRYSRSGSRR